jgi:hypothetical protein
MPRIPNLTEPFRVALVLLALLLVATVLLAQGAGQKGKKAPEKGKQAQKEKPSKRIFGGRVTLVSSRQESDTAGHGFKGVDEDGSVQKAVLASQPGGGDYQQVAQMRESRASADELAAFLQEGGLRTQSSRRRRRS